MPLPKSLPWMESVDAKMIRAHEHIETLDRACTEYLASVKLNLYLKTAPHLPNPWLVVVANDYIPPIALSAVLGDCVHNMRATLDNLICGLARTQDRFCTCVDTAFPYTQSQADWNASRTQASLLGVPKAAKKIIKSVQPWCNPSVPSPLIMLNKLSNIDKHRHCNLGLAYSRDTVFRIHYRDGCALDITPKTPLYLGDVHSFTLPIASSLVASSTRVQSGGTFVITFQEEGPWGDVPIMQVLQDCFDYIERAVIRPLTPFFKPPNESSDSL